MLHDVAKDPIAFNFTVKQVILICIKKKNQLNATEWFIALIICSTCFGHFYAHRQKLETLYVLLPPMVRGVLVAGCRRSGTGQQAMRPGRDM